MFIPKVQDEVEDGIFCFKDTFQNPSIQCAVIRVCYIQLRLKMGLKCCMKRLIQMSILIIIVV